MSEEKKVLSQRELENISGGAGRGASASARGRSSASAGGRSTASGEQMCQCTTCGKSTPHICYSGGRSVCSICGETAWG